MSRWKLWVLGAASIVVRVVTWTAGTVFRIRYARFVMLDSAAKRAVERGALDTASVRAGELLALADGYPQDWNYGNAIHDGHLVLGRVALALGDVEKAKDELLAAGRTPGSPQLNSFGPNMRLAEDLLRVGERDVVLQYFELCDTFWEMNRGRLSQWSAEVQDGRAPTFGPNLVY